MLACHRNEGEKSDHDYDNGLDDPLVDWKQQSTTVEW
jgi:hypothetical protein